MQKRTITSEELAYVDALVSVLNGRGLTARALTGGMVSVENRAALPAEQDARGRSLHPGLRQEVICRPGTEDGPWWHWVWSGPERDSEPELEPLCPAWRTEEAANRITRVLALQPEGAS